MRFIAQRALTGEFLDWELPLSAPEITRELSGPGSVSGVISPETARMRDSDGRLILDEWGTFVYPEADGLIRAGTIVVNSRFEGPEWRLDCAGFTTYPHGVPYIGRLREIEIDPLDVVREIWEHMQAQPDGDLGMIVDNTTSAVTVGTPLVYEADLRKDSQENWWILDRLTQDVRDNPPDTDTPIQDTADEALDHLRDDGVIREDFSWNGMSALAKRFNDSLRFVFYARNPDHNYSWPESKSEYETFLGSVNQLYRRTDAQPYELLWWEDTDCGQEIDSLVDEIPFDYLEEHNWNSDKTDVEHRLRLGYPRFGRKRSDLRFAQDENLIDVVTPERDGSRFANEGIGRGAGEGREMTRVRIPQRDGRLRRPFLFTDKTVGRKDRLRALTRDELNSRRQLLEIPEVVVEAEHDNAKWGSYRPGDDIRVQAEVDWVGEVDVWHRITSETYRPDEGTVTLQLRRSDAFRYGSISG